MHKQIPITCENIRGKLHYNRHTLNLAKQKLPLENKKHQFVI